MFLGDRVALEDLVNHSICVKTDEGIKNISNSYDVITANLVYVEQIFTLEDQIKGVNVIQKGEMVRYNPAVLILR